MPMVYKGYTRGINFVFPVRPLVQGFFTTCLEFTVPHQQFVELFGTESYPFFTVLNTIQR